MGVENEDEHDHEDTNPGVIVRAEIADDEVTDGSGVLVLPVRPSLLENELTRLLAKGLRYRGRRDEPLETLEEILAVLGQYGRVWAPKDPPLPVLVPSEVDDAADLIDSDGYGIDYTAVLR